MAYRKTKQKEILEKEAESFNGLFNAEELHAKVKNKGIGIATVYRFLKELGYHTYTCERKIIYSREETNHSHFTCEQCGKTQHLNIENIDFIKKNIKGKPCHIQIDVTGVCNNCLNKNQ